LKEIFKGRFIRLAMIFGILPLLLFFIARNSLLEYSLERIKTKIREKYSADFIFSDAYFKGLSTIHIENTGILTPDRDTLFYLKSIAANVRLIPLAGGKIRLSELKASDGNLMVIATDRHNNFSWLLARKREGGNFDQENKTTPDYANLLEKLNRTIFESIPDVVELSNLNATILKDTCTLKVRIPIALLENRDFSARIKGEDNIGKFEWSAGGTIDRNLKRGKFIFYPIGTESNRLPVSGSWIKLKAGADTIRVNLEQTGMENSDFRIKGSMKVNGMWIDHWRLAPSEIIIGDMAMDYDWKLSDKALILSSGSNMSLNKLNIGLEGSFIFSPNKEYAFHAKINRMKSQDFFSSIPKNLFINIEDIKTSGELAYKLNFNLIDKIPDSVLFNSELNAINFRIKSYGKENLVKINSDFDYDVYEKNHFIKKIHVGKSNADFVSLENIPSILINSVLTSEDGNFFSHNGFNANSFRKSISENYKKRKFARGGSTISMQLVKNVFLTRNKTVARKIEEAIIVWLIEENRLVSKERMLEVYLNIIEWGPGIYGIGQATQFYFGKKPNEINLEECIFLSMIIPRPKGFSYHFDQDEKLKEYTSSYFNLMSGLLLRKGIIDSTMSKIDIQNLIIRGEAKRYLTKNKIVQNSDSIAADSLFIPEIGR
jgi:hypothetical protein